MRGYQPTAYTNPHKFVLIETSRIFGRLRLKSPHFWGD
nr:MAG TPA: hypothetical protein [Caudoviricetes sp.]